MKLTGLSVNTTYELYLVLRTSAGSFPSNKVNQPNLILMNFKVQVTTHSMENLTGLYPAFGAFSNEAEVDNLLELLTRFISSV